jgi:hypothetical protein
MFCFGPKGGEHRVDLIISAVSGKRIVMLDGELLHKVMSRSTPRAAPYRAAVAIDAFAR